LCTCHAARDCHSVRPRHDEELFDKTLPTTPMGSRLRSKILGAITDHLGIDLAQE
jgi:hypothetical protein